jgi:hypothetical protein
LAVGCVSEHERIGFITGRHIGRMTPLHSTIGSDAGLTGRRQDCPFVAPMIKVATFLCRNPAWLATKWT